MSEKRGRPGGSTVWEYYRVKIGGSTVAICKICDAEIRRGKVGSSSKNFSTKSMWQHLSSTHKDEHSAAIDERKIQEKDKAKQQKLEDQKKSAYLLTDIFVAASGSKTKTSSQLSITNSLIGNIKWKKISP